MWLARLALPKNPTSSRHRAVERQIWGNGEIRIASGSELEGNNSRIPASHGAVATCLDGVTNPTTVEDHLHGRLHVLAGTREHDARWLIHCVEEVPGTSRDILEVTILSNPYDCGV